MAKMRSKQTPAAFKIFKSMFRPTLEGTPPPNSSTLAATNGKAIKMKTMRVPARQTDAKFFKNPMPIWRVSSKPRRATGIGAKVR